MSKKANLRAGPRKLRVYLAVPLIQNRDRTRAKKLAETIEALGHRLLSRWVLKPDPGWSLKPSKVFARDVKSVIKCDVLIADGSEASHGVGMELMLAHRTRKSVIFLARRGRKVSHMVKGIPNLRIVEYSTVGDLRRSLAATLRELVLRHTGR